MLVWIATLVGPAYDPSSPTTIARKRRSIQFRCRVCVWCDCTHSNVWFQKRSWAGMLEYLQHVVTFTMAWSINHFKGTFISRTAYTYTVHKSKQNYIMKSIIFWDGGDIPSKRRLQLNRLHGVTSQKMILFITTAVKTSNPTELH
jgi:hypothetical protein